MTGVIAEEVYAYLEEKTLLPEEQKGCRKNSRGTNDLLFIDRRILREVKMQKKNLSIAWIDYKKAYDMVPHSWILECLEILRISDQIKAFLEESMKTWRVDLTCGNDTLERVNIEGHFSRGLLVTTYLCYVPHTTDEYTQKRKCWL